MQHEVFPQFRAPRQDGQSLLWPSLWSVPKLLAANRLVQQSLPAELAMLRDSARRRLIQQALQYTGQYRDSATLADDAELQSLPIIMSGHQPTLFHPGVWFKNYSLSQISAQQNALAINLVVDGDVSGPTSISVPVRTPGNQLELEKIPYDHAGAGLPYEQSSVSDQESFDRFGQAVAHRLRGFIDDPLIGKLWPQAIERRLETNNTALAIAGARHALEGDMGWQTLEVPQGQICQTPQFASFLSLILADLPRFVQCYNDSADLYRGAHGIRSSAHPVPNLSHDAPWLEAPLWIYGDASPQRRAVWVRQRGTELTLSDRQGFEITCNHEHLSECLQSLDSSQYKLRSRALITTMYVRMLLSDLFLHGIGGGKYDQLGDLISQAFWQCPPTQFMVLSASVLLPGHQRHCPLQINQQLHEVHRTLRDCRFHGEQFDGEHAVSADLVQQKHALLERIPPRRQRKQWHAQMQAVNLAMSKQLSQLATELHDRSLALQAERRLAERWNSRDYSFCLYPQEQIQNAFDTMLLH
ncbi:MAG: hypothetical protein CBB71_03090 [Rhodopirellula sp. TMED11]|nr:MAG: hypothetical protein CBB71_03090 [Rhodopirellula sp. TMED11]